jgi:hypothetical protein
VKKAALTLQAGIVEVEEGTFRGTIGIVERNPMPALGGEARHLLFVQRFPGHNHRRCPLAPEVNEMRLAATLRTMQHQRAPRPPGPSLDPADGRDIAFGDEEVRAA